MFLVLKASLRMKHYSRKNPTKGNHKEKELEPDQNAPETRPYLNFSSSVSQQIVFIVSIRSSWDLSVATQSILGKIVNTWCFHPFLLLEILLSFFGEIGPTPPPPPPCPTTTTKKKKSRLSIKAQPTITSQATVGIRRPNQTKQSLFLIFRTSSEAEMLGATCSPTSSCVKKASRRKKSTLDKRRVLEHSRPWFQMILKPNLQ